MTDRTTPETRPPHPSPDATPDLSSRDPDWWRQAVVYQVYPRSFADADGDGLGDLRGITRRLTHLATLGVDALWMSPFYPSELADGGYDVADPRDVDPRLGTLDDFDALVAEAHRLGLKVIVDIVPNHTSHQHVWFQEALRAGPGSPARQDAVVSRAVTDSAEASRTRAAAGAWVIEVPPGEPGRPGADVLLRHHRAGRSTSATGRPGERRTLGAEPSRAPPRPGTMGRTCHTPHPLGMAPRSRSVRFYGVVDSFSDGTRTHPEETA